MCVFYQKRIICKIYGIVSAFLRLGLQPTYFLNLKFIYVKNSIEITLRNISVLVKFTFTRPFTATFKNIFFWILSSTTRGYLLIRTEKENKNFLSKFFPNKFFFSLKLIITILCNSQENYQSLHNKINKTLKITGVIIILIKADKFHSKNLQYFTKFWNQFIRSKVIVLVFVVLNFVALLQNTCFLS